MKERAIFNQEQIYPLYQAVVFLQDLQYSEKKSILVDLSEAEFGALVSLIKFLIKNGCIKNKFEFHSSGTIDVHDGNLNRIETPATLNLLSKDFEIEFDLYSANSCVVSTSDTIEHLRGESSGLVFGSSSESCFSGLCKTMSDKIAFIASNKSKNIVNGGACREGTLMGDFNIYFSGLGAKVVNMVYLKKYWSKAEEDVIKQMLKVNPDLMIRVYKTDSVIDRVRLMISLSYINDGCDVYVGPGGLGTIEEILISKMFLGGKARFNIDGAPEPLAGFVNSLT